MKERRIYIPGENSFGEDNIQRTMEIMSANFLNEHGFSLVAVGVVRDEEGTVKSLLCLTDREDASELAHVVEVRRNAEFTTVTIPLMHIPKGVFLDASGKVHSFMFSEIDPADMQHELMGLFGGLGDVRFMIDCTEWYGPNGESFEDKQIIEMQEKYQAHQTGAQYDDEDER